MAAGSLLAIPQPTLTTEDLTLRPWNAGDTDLVRTAFADPDIQRWFTRRMDSATEAREWAEDWVNRWAAETAASWAIDTGDVVGQVGLRAISLFDGAAEVSYWLLPAGRGRGIAARAVDMMTRWAFADLGLHRLVIQHSTRNTASCRVAEKAGFPAEGTRRDALRHTDGWHDMHVHARLST